ncbi:MAG TPA: permease-like cell division protein FtsX, partial [Ferruginibacter sp.]|nr:permease-like cell division protein FtsX [Ferruginibacter sp.]
MKPHTEKLPFRTKPNYLYSIVSVTLVLFLLGFFGFILLYAQRVVTIFKERVNVLVEIKTDTDSIQVLDLEDHIKQLAGTRRGTIAFVSKEDAAQQMREVFGEDFVHLDMPNPFYDMVSFNVRAQYMNPDSLETMRTELREWQAVNDVYYQENLANKIGG